MAHNTADTEHADPQHAPPIHAASIFAAAESRTTWNWRCVRQTASDIRAARARPDLTKLDDRLEWHEIREERAVFARQDYRIGPEQKGRARQVRCSGTLHAAAHVHLCE